MVPRSTELCDVLATPERFCEAVLGIVTPLHAENWESLLRSTGLLPRYPLLPYKIRNGFSISDMPPIARTDIPPNHKSAREHFEVVASDILSEVAKNRVAGPFTTAALKHIVGDFRTSPLSVVEKAGSPGQLRVVRDLSAKGGLDASVNNEINSDEWPTRWDGAKAIASYVS